MAAAPPNPAAKAASQVETAAGVRGACLPSTLSGRVFRTSAAFVIALIVLSQGISAPFIKDAEPQSAQWIVNIVRNGNWLLPHDYYGFVERKPPLFYWLSAVVAEASGGSVDEVRARAVSLMAGAVLATIVMVWSCEQLGAFGGWLAFFFLLGTYGYASRATTALTDMLMTLLLFSVYVIALPYRGNTATLSTRRTLAAGVILGLAILTKGPVTMVLLALAVSIYLLMERENPLRLLLCRWPWVMFAVAVAIAATWYVPAALAGGSALVGVFVDENFGHFMSARMGGTGEAARPFYYIAVRILGGGLPLTCLVPAVAIASVNNDSGASGRSPIKSQLALALAVLILFSAASTKRDDYILPAMPPLAILFASLFCETGVNDQSKTRRRSAPMIRDITVALIAAVMIIGTVALLIYAKLGGSMGGTSLALQSSDASYAAIFLQGLARFGTHFALFFVAIVAGASVVFIGVARGRPRWSGIGLAILSLAASLLWTSVLRPAEARTRSLERFALEVRNRVNGAPLYVAYDNPEFAWYYGGGVPALPRAVARHGSDVDVFLVARPGELARIAPAVRNNLEIALHSQVLGGGGAPALFVLKRAESGGGSHGEQ